MNPDAARFVGEAFTLRLIPSREDIATIDAVGREGYAQRAAIESVPEGHVLVADARGDRSVGTMGEILLTRLMVRGAVAYVTDGCVRDSKALHSFGMPVFVAGAASGIHLARHHAVDTQVPIGCAGVGVYPGDILVGDHDGVVCIPRRLAEDVANAAAEQESLELYIAERVRNGAALKGVYPADESTRAAHRRWSAAQQDRAR
jgi:regulator of RNase E activity RraA